MHFLFLCLIRAVIEPQEFLNVVQVMGKQFSKRSSLCVCVCVCFSSLLTNIRLFEQNTFYAIDTLAMENVANIQQSDV